MDNETQKQLIARLRRLEGQVRALEVSIARDEADRVVTQLQAVIAASRATLRHYLEVKLLSEAILNESAKRLLARVIEKGT